MPIRKLGDPLFGLYWNSNTRWWRLLLCKDKYNKGIMEYFSQARYGSKQAALKAAQARRDVLMQTPKVAQFYRYQIDGMRVRRPKVSEISPPITGVSFSEGWSSKGLQNPYPVFVVSAKGVYQETFCITLRGARKALELAVKSRWRVEGRRFNRKAFEQAYEEWLELPSIKRFMNKHSINE